MDSTPNKHRPVDTPPKAERGNAATNDEELIAFARGYFAEDFPNPDRAGCPARGALRGAAESGRLPSGELRAHLFGCSPCLREFREAMALRGRARAWSVAAWLRELGAAITHRPAAVAFSSLVVLIVLASSLSLWRVRRSSETAVRTAAVVENVNGPQALPSLSPPSDANVAAEARPTATPEPTVKPAPRRRSGRAADARAGRDLIAANTVRIDLEDYALLRDAGETGAAATNFIRLAPSRSRLVLRLPETNVGGLYEVSVVDAFDKPLVKTKARSRDGRTLTAALNLRGLGGKKHRLRVAREGEAPAYYPLLVEKRSARAPARKL